MLVILAGPCYVIIHLAFLRSNHTAIHKQQ